MKNSDNNKTAIVLGGTTPHIELIQQLKSRGYYVILVDYLDNPPAKVFADKHIKESTLDQNKVLEIAQKNKVELVISACIDQANSVCCFVAEKMGLPHPYSYETSILVTEKNKMKQIMFDNNIPTSDFQQENDKYHINWSKVKFPAVVKPSDCNSSKGVRKVLNIEEGKKYLIEALNYSRTKQAIVEEFVSGTEIQVDCFATNNDAMVILTRQKKHIQLEDSEELNSEGSIIPAPICEGKTEILNEIACKISKVFNLKNTPFFYQAIIDNSGKIFVLEFAPRVGGGLSYYILRNIAGFDAVKAVIDSYLGIKITPKTYDLNCYYSTNLLYMNEGLFDHISGLDEAKERKIILESFVTKKPGTYVDSNLRSGNRVGAFIVKAKSTDELKKLEDEAYSLIDIIDNNGQSKIRNWR